MYITLATSVCVLCANGALLAYFTHRHPLIIAERESM